MSVIRRRRSGHIGLRRLRNQSLCCNLGAQALAYRSLSRDACSMTEAGCGSGLWILCQLSMRRVKQRLDVVLVARQIRREVGALRQTQAGASRQKIDNLRAPAGGADNPVHLEGVMYFP